MPARESLRALMIGVIDYAGLFPPAKLPLDSSIRNYARYLHESPEAWMLGRFICPAARLAELLPFVHELFAEGPVLRVSALGQGGAGEAQFVDHLAADLRQISAFRDAAEGRAVVDVLETRLPPSSQAAADVLPELTGRCLAASLRPFGEAGFEDDWRENLAHVIHAMRAQRGVGYKLRSGGVEASAFPSTEQVAFAIATCREAGVPMKFTAGLHHPVRHFNASVDTKMHGFLNVFTACTLAHARKMPESQLLRVLEDEDPCAFTMRDYGLAWQDTAVSTERIQAARAEFAISFGSCSFEEPVDDLRALGML